MPLAQDPGARRREAEEFIAGLDDPDRAVVTALDLGIVVAHPDDETIGCGAQLRRLRDATVVVVTDGAPRNLADARRHGFDSVDSYSDKRARELRNALSLAGVPERNIILLGLSDQTAALRLVELTRTIYCLLIARNIRLALTHAYEGGHPDHDATCFAVHAAAALANHHGQRITILEMPLYRADNAHWALQSFAPCRNEPERAIRLTEDERRLKRRMMDAYATQSGTLAPFGIEAERFRVAPDYDFTSLPNDGKLLYERYDWGMNGERWIALAGEALRELGLEDGQWR